MYTLGIPDRLKRRTLGYLKQQFVDFEENPSMEGFIDVGFPGMDEDAFRNIVMKLKQQGVTTIGADEELTERKIMKLTDLVEDFSKNLDEQENSSIIDALKNILIQWENKQYADDKSRWEEYYLDIQELVQDFEEDIPQPSVAVDSYRNNNLPALEEQKLRKAIRKLMRQ